MVIVPKADNLVVVGTSWIVPSFDNISPLLIVDALDCVT